MIIKRGDLEPPLVATLTDGTTGAVVDLTTATSVAVICMRSGAVLFNRAPQSATALGVVTMPWQTADTATAGDLDIEIQVTWPGSRPQTFPADGYLQVTVVSDLA